MLTRGALRALFSLLVATLGFACDGDDISDNPPPGLDNFLPELPEPTGEPQSVWAGGVSASNAEELIPGPATQGLVGDYYLRNSKARFVIQAPSIAVGVVTDGGNLIDAVPVADDGSDAAPDHFGEISIIYQLGRACIHSEVEVVRDGSQGGVAVIRARGVTDANRMVNMKGLGVLPIQNDLDPTIPDGAECATTYVLEPNSPVLQVHFTLFNPTQKTIVGPMGMMSDTGGEVSVFQPHHGFSRLGSIEDALDALGQGAPYMVWQGPKVAYGILPRHEDVNTPNSSIVILGVSIFVFGIEEFLHVLESDKNRFLSLAPQTGVTHQIDVLVARDAADVERQFRSSVGEELIAATGQVTWDDGSPAAGARVAIFDQDDEIVTYADVDDEGHYRLDLKPGAYMARAEVLNEARSTEESLSVPTQGPVEKDFALDRPVTYHYRIVDDENGDALIPARIMVIGSHPVEPDLRSFGFFDRLNGLVTRVFATRGTSTDMGEGADEAIRLPVGGTYRIIVTRGTEWSAAEAAVSPTAGETPDELEFRLRKLVDSPGYLSSEYHVHSIGSSDSTVTNLRRVMTAVADGIEFYATTDHDNVVDQQPFVEVLGLTRLVRTIPGIEMSPLVYGHFNAWPLEVDENSPNGGAINWTQGPGDYAMTPGEIFAAARDRGAELVQVNHPRSGPRSQADLSQNFDRIGLTFDYEQKTFYGDEAKMPVLPSWLRLPPDESYFSDAFNALEVWNGVEMGDTDGDGVREMTLVDTVMRDWFNFLSFGKNITPLGNSDTHYEVLELMGNPRTMVRVADGLDTPDALETGTDVVRSVLDTLGAQNDAMADVVVTDGPMIYVTVDNDDRPLGKVLDGTDGEIEIDISVQSPDWAHIDTIEVFANSTPDTDDIDVSSLSPVACYTSRTNLHEADPCGQAALGGADTLTVETVELAPGFTRYEANISLSLRPEDIVLREGAVGQDAWVVVRVRGQRAIYPVHLGNLFDDVDVESFVTGTDQDREDALAGRGRTAAAFTSAFFVDFDGGGYRAVFAP